MLRIVRNDRPSEESVHIRKLPIACSADSIRGSGRELMRHSDGTLHAALLEMSESGTPRIGLFGIGPNQERWKRLHGPLSPDTSTGDSEPATDSNSNGTYTAYIQASKGGSSGWIAHHPDPFGDPAHFSLNGPVTPLDETVVGSFLQASRNFNSVVYGWRDVKRGVIYVGVSRDGREFPEARVVVKDPELVHGPAVAVYGDYVLVAYMTRDTSIAPVDHRSIQNDVYHAYVESNDGGKTWSRRMSLIRNVSDLPRVTGFSLDESEDLRRVEFPLLGAAREKDSLQALAWPVEALDSSKENRLFVLTSLIPDNLATWDERDNSVGVLNFKPIEPGGDWHHVVTNTALFSPKGASGSRRGESYKYSALPETPIRAVSYVERTPSGCSFEDRVVLMLSTNTGQLWDQEHLFNISDLGFAPTHPSRSRIVPVYMQMKMVRSGWICFAQTVQAPLTFV